MRNVGCCRRRVEKLAPKGDDVADTVFTEGELPYLCICCHLLHCFNVLHVPFCSKLVLEKSRQADVYCHTTYTLQFILSSHFYLWSQILTRLPRVALEFVNLSFDERKN